MAGQSRRWAAHNPSPLLPIRPPPTLQILIHKNECYDIGTLGWFFASGTVELSSYKYFIFLNASVRGPFLPAYWPVSAGALSSDVREGSGRWWLGVWLAASEQQALALRPHTRASPALHSCPPRRLGCTGPPP